MFERVKELLERVLDREEFLITPDTDIVAAGGINSLELVELICTFEEEFGIRIPDKDISKFRYIRDITVYLEEKTGGG
jgi:acyl carrier protein